MLADKLKEWLESDDAEKFFEKERLQDELQESRYRRFETWLEDNDFDMLMFRLIQEHNDEYVDKCYDKGFMPYPNNKLGFVLDYVTENLEPITVNELRSDFGNDIYLFRGYYFQHIHGQGVITRIYNKNDMKMLLQI